MKTENGEGNVDLSHRKVLVTGGGSGLGRVLAVEFANTGAEVHVCGRRREPLDELASANKNIIAHQLDVTDEDGTEAMFECHRPGRDPDRQCRRRRQCATAPDIQRNVAPDHGGQPDRLLSDLPCRAETASGREGAMGPFIAISSTTGLSGHKYASAYSASKHGVNGLVKSAAAELAGSGITANALCPGYLDTEMTGPHNRQHRRQDWQKSATGHRYSCRHEPAWTADCANGSQQGGAVAVWTGNGCRQWADNRDKWW